jgi:UDP-glucose 4-epimerase
MKVLVTGGAGYIGAHTVKLLQGSGHRVIVLDTLEHGKRSAIGDTPLVIGNTADRLLVERVLRDEAVDAVIHFAAYKAAGESMEQPGRYFDNNVCGTLSLLEAMVATGIKYLVFSSTAAVYGTPAKLPVTEDHPLQPENPYGASKLMVEQMLQWFDRSHGLRSVALRYFNAAGADPDGTIGEDWTRTLNLVPVVMKAVLGRSPAIKVFGTDYPTPDGTAIRDYIHVVDLAAAHIKALDYLTRKQTSNIFNLGTGTGSSVRQVIDMTRQVSGRDVPVEYTERRPGDPVGVWADNTKAREVLDWTPRYGLQEIIQTAWQWHSTHPEG